MGSTVDSVRPLNDASRSPDRPRFSIADGRLDLAKTQVNLTAGGLYRATTDAGSAVFRISRRASGSSASIISRLVRLYPGFGTHWKSAALPRRTPRADIDGAGPSQPLADLNDRGAEYAVVTPSGHNLISPDRATAELCLARVEVRLQSTTLTLHRLFNRQISPQNQEIAWQHVGSRPRFYSTTMCANILGNREESPGKYWVISLYG